MSREPGPMEAQLKQILDYENPNRNTVEPIFYYYNILFYNGKQYQNVIYPAVKMELGIPDFLTAAKRAGLEDPIQVHCVSFLGAQTATQFKGEAPLLPALVH